MPWLQVETMWTEQELVVMGTLPKFSLFPFSQHNLMTKQNPQEWSQKRSQQPLPDGRTEPCRQSSEGIWAPLAAASGGPVEIRWGNMKGIHALLHDLDRDGAGNMPPCLSELGRWAWRVPEADGECGSGARGSRAVGRSRSLLGQWACLCAQPWQMWATVPRAHSRPLEGSGGKAHNVRTSGSNWLPRPNSWFVAQSFNYKFILWC